MPFPPVSRPRSLYTPPNDNAREDRSVCESPAPLYKSPEETRSLKDCFTSNLQLGPKPQSQQLGRKLQPKSKLPISRSASGLREEGKNIRRLTPGSSSEGNRSVPPSSSGESVTQRGESYDPLRSSSAKEHRVEKEKVHFSLSLTPEAILVIQRRNIEKQRAAKSCAPVESRRRRSDISAKRLQGSNRCAITDARIVNNTNTDISSMVKISLLNDRHKYDDVEYEEEDGRADECVVLKCTEWLKGLESASILGKTDKTASLKRFYKDGKM